MNKRIYLLLIVLAVLLAGCAGMGDWRVKLAGPLEIWRCNSEEIVLVRRTSESGGTTWVDAKIVGVAYNDEFVCLQRQPKGADEIVYHIVLTENGKRFGPLTPAEFAAKCGELGVPDLGAWVRPEDLPNKVY